MKQFTGKKKHERNVVVGRNGEAYYRHNLHITLSKFAYNCRKVAARGGLKHTVTKVEENI